MPMTADELKDKVKLRIHTLPNGDPRQRDVIQSQSYDPETEEIDAPVAAESLELSWELEAIIDAVCEGVIEMCEEKGLLLKDVDITAGATVDGGITSDTLDVVG